MMPMKKNEDSNPKKIWSLRNLPDMDDQQFQQWQALLELRTGMHLALERKTFLQTSIGIRMREIECEAYQDYYDFVTTGANRVVEWATLVDRLTVQETSFFRHHPSYQIVRDYISERATSFNASSPLAIWSLGCSTGEETYSLAMLADECAKSAGVGQQGTKFFGVTGTDISLPAIAKARNGVYQERKLSNIEPYRRNAYFDQVNNERWQIKESLRDRVCFAQVNVLELHKAPMQGMDVVYCQNLLIYFPRLRRRKIVEQMVRCLAPGGLLVLGLGEVVDWQHEELVRVSGGNSLAFTRRELKN